MLVAAVVVSGCTRPPTEPATIDLEAWLEGRLSDVDAHDPYDEPTDADQSTVSNALRTTSADAVTDLLPNALRSMQELSNIGIREFVRVDTESGKRVTMLAAEDGTARAWGTVVYQPGVPIRTVIEVPHPRSDVDTELLGVELFRRMPGSALVVAGAHRGAGSRKEADVAHNQQSIFQTAVLTLADKASVEIQVHGFDQRSLPGVDAIPSPGPTKVTPRHQALATALHAYGFHVCAGWTSKCGDLRGHTNVQGAAAAVRHTPFLHLEMAKRLRADPTNRAKVVSALARTWGYPPPR